MSGQGPDTSPSLTLRSLTLPEFWVVGLSAILLPICRLAIRCFPATLLRHLMEPAQGAKPGGADGERTARLVHAVAARHPIHANCLTRSVLLVLLLRNRGVAALLRIGVRVADGSLSAHAWVEHEGVPLHESAQMLQEYQPFCDPVALEAFTVRRA